MSEKNWINKPNYNIGKWLKKIFVHKRRLIWIYITRLKLAQLRFDKS